MSDWHELDAFLETDPADVGCDEARWDPPRLR